MAFVTGLEMGKLLCDALGLDANKVFGIHLSCVIGEIVTVTVDMYGDDGLKELAEKTYNLTEVTE